MKYPKLWNGPSAVGEALVRALQMTGVPYLSARTADGVYAGVMDGKAEVKKQGGGDYVCCVYRTYETLNLLSRYPHGFYYVYLGVRSDTNEPDGRAEGYYANPTDAYLGPLQLSGSGVWTGDFWTWPFITSVDDTGYYTKFGEYAGPPAYSGGGPLMHRYALIDVSSGRVAYRKQFGPWEGVRYRYGFSYVELPVWFRGGLRIPEYPGRESGDLNTWPWPSFGYSRFSAIRASLRDMHPDGIPSDFNPDSNLDSSPIRAPGTALVCAAGRLYWIESYDNSSINRLRRLAVSPTGDTAMDETPQINLLASYSWTLASDDKYIVVGGWRDSAGRGILELYDLNLNRVWYDYVPANDQPYQVAVGNGRVATVTINSPSEMFLWDLRALLRGVGPAGSRQAVPVGRRAPDGTPLPPFLGPGLGGRFYYPEGVAIKRRRVFVMHAGKRYTDGVVIMDTGEITVEVFKLNGEYVKTIPVHTAAPGEGFADRYDYAIIQVPQHKAGV